MSASDQVESALHTVEKWKAAGELSGGPAEAVTNALLLVLRSGAPGGPGQRYVDTDPAVRQLASSIAETIQRADSAS